MQKINTKLFLTILILLGVIFQSAMMFKSGRIYSFGVGFWGPLARDGVWHEALAGQLVKNVPPVNPGFAGTTLVNYHYYYDLLVAVVHRLTALPVNTLIYIVFPLLFSVTLGVLTYQLANVLFKNKWASMLAVFFAYFGSSFGWIVELGKRGSIWGGESAFWANQPVSMNLNPPFAISLCLVIATTLLLNSYLGNASKLKALGVIILSGVLIGFKAYAGVVILAGLLFLGLKKVFMDRDIKVLVIFGLAAGIAFGYLITSGTSTGLITFLPFWLIDTMIDAGDRVGIVNFTARRFAYLAEGRWLRLALLQMVSFTIFFVGNLGTRIVAIGAIKKKLLRSDLHLFIVGVMAASLVPPLLFVQKGNPWNIIQFFYYFLYFAGLFAAGALVKAPKWAVALVLILTPISSLASFRSALYPNPPAYLSTAEAQALTFLRGQPDGVVLKHPFDPALRSRFTDPYPLPVYADSSYVSAYSGKAVYIEDVEQQIILDSDYKPRLAGATNLFATRDLAWSSDFLKKHIDYIYLPKIYQLPAAEQEYPMVKIYENSAANIYRVLK